MMHDGWGLPDMWIWRQRMEFLWRLLCDIDSIREGLWIMTWGIPLVIALGAGHSVLEIYQRHGVDL